MSTQPNLTPQWKEEVNRRIAAHKNRRAQSSAQESTPQANLGESRAAQAAARVAARYAKAPTYSQMQAEETRVVVRAAEIATKVALEAQEAAEAALAEMHAATQEQSRGPAVVHTIPVPPVGQAARAPEINTGGMPAAASKPMAEHAGVAMEAPQPAVQETVAAVEIEEKKPEPRRIFGIRWDPDLPRRSADKKPDPRRSTREEFELSTEDWWSPAEVAESLRSNPIEVGEGDQLHANLIQFPRELVATRKIRPHAGGAADLDRQLSIFEVDPASISTEAGTPLAEQGGAASVWNRPEWSGMRLDTQPAPAPAAAREANHAPANLPVAPFGLRVMATVVDCALILASFVVVGFLVAHSATHPPTGKAAELLGMAGLGLIGILYYAVFFALPVSTPGMKYAGIGLCTFDDQSPTRAQLRRRLGAMFLSLLPVGLGLVWSVFDEDHLSWHDRYSQTYLRKL